MQSSDDSSACGSSSSCSVVSGTKNRSSTFTVVKSNKSLRNIVITQNSANEQKVQKAQRRQQIKENEREQQRLDLDVILSGFPVKPVCKTVVQSFLDIHKIPSGKVQTSFQFENRTVNKTFYHIVITFADKTSKAQLFVANNKLGNPIRWNQISGNDRIENNPIINFHNRFSKFNFWAEKQLYRLKGSGIIVEYKFKNVFYCFKQTPASEWQDVSIAEDLADLIDLVK
ncbi:hypothetical protein HA402_007732 [Bradysia odoriphaga]|nr:hypothetical protein HA402_007732 [Bradysia odoriphaga]